MEYCFLIFNTTRGELIRRYGIKEEDSFLAETVLSSESLDTGDTVSVILCFYRDQDGDICEFSFSGSLTLSDIEKYYKRKIKVCKTCKKPITDCSCASQTGYKSINTDYEIIKGGENESAISVPYYVPKSLPIVVRRNTSGEESLLGQSDCEYIRPEQQAINKIESRILQKLLRSGITPIVPEGTSIALNNSVFGQIIKMRPGESMAQYGKVDTTPNIAQDIAEAERLYEHAKRIIGISDAYQGIGGENESGVARSLKISQSSGRLESKKKMKHTAYARLDRLIFEHYLAFADEPRPLAHKDPFGKISNFSFNRHDFLAYDMTGGFRYDDEYLFSVDLNGGAEYQREALWQRNLDNLRSGTLGDPASPKTLLRYWQCQERAHYPYARENVEYFREILKEGDDPYGKDDLQ